MLQGLKLHCDSKAPRLQTNSITSEQGSDTAYDILAFPRLGRVIANQSIAYRIHII